MKLCLRQSIAAYSLYEHVAQQLQMLWIKQTNADDNASNESFRPYETNTSIIIFIIYIEMILRFIIFDLYEKCWCGCSTPHSGHSSE